MSILIIFIVGLNPWQLKTHMARFQHGYGSGLCPGPQMGNKTLQNPGFFGTIEVKLPKNRTMAAVDRKQNIVSALCKHLSMLSLDPVRF